MKSTDRGFLGQLKDDPGGEIEAARLQRGKSLRENGDAADTRSLESSFQVEA